MYDAQIGRWSSADPIADKWNSYSPYNYVVNNCVNVIDPDGKDAIYSYDEKTKTITITAKIYYKGTGISADSKKREKQITEINSALKEVYKNGTATVDKTEYSVVFNVTAEIDQNIEEKDLKAGENIMNISSDMTKLADGGDRAGVRGDKTNMGYLAGRDNLNINIHEIDYMISLKDRYTDYENASNTKLWRSIIHEGYKNDIMGSAARNLNQSHYDNMVKYTIFKLVQGQKTLLEQYRATWINVTQNVDANSSSSPATADIPDGWRPRGVEK